MLYGKSFGLSNLFNMRIFYTKYSKFQTVSGKCETLSHILTWSHYVQILEYALDNINNHLFVSKYQLFLPDKEQLEKELKRIIENEE